MSWREDFYSRLVAWLKILLPLAALGLLSTLFLISRGGETGDGIPFAEFDLEQRARDQGVTAPSFAGATEAGDLVTFTASSARPDPEDRNRALASHISARIELSEGGEVRFSAKSGTLDQGSDTARLVGGVTVTSSTGYRVLTEDLVTGIETLRAETGGPVEADGPPGRFSAGRMVMRSDPASGHVQLVFTEGVKLVYDPAEKKE